MITSILFSCSRIDDIENRLDVLEQKVETLEQAVSALQSAYDGGKIITGVDALDNGYKITFSDNTAININHGKNGITPLLSIDTEGYWMVSYDNGETFQRLTDSQGNPIIGVGRDGADGADGKDGKDGICVRVVVNEEGYYVFEAYYPNAPDTVIDTVVTDYTSDKSKILSSIVENTEDGTITITMANSDTFTFFASEKIFEIEKRLDELEARVKTLEDALKVLEDAYKDGKIIVSVEKIDGGHKILFSDDSSIEVLNGKDGQNGEDGQNGSDGKDGADGKDGITPIISMDSNGYWTVSYDNGETFSKLVDSQGNHVGGIGKDGNDGNDGTDGKNGISVRVVVNESGYYTFELYDAANPDVVIDTIVTPLTSVKANIISSITQDNATGVITITMANGDSFTFNHKKIIPSSIAVLGTKPLMIGNEGTATFEFRVNPSNASFDYNVDSEGCEILLDLVAGTRSYVTTPSNYKLSKVERVYNEQGVMKVGQYKAYITDLGLNTVYKDLVALVVNTADENGANVEVSSSAIELQYTSNTISEFQFLSKNNPTCVISDVTAVIEGNEIKISSPFISSVTGLVATFSSNGYKVMVKGVEQESGITANDFSSPVTYRVVDQEGNAMEYKVYVLYSGLPVVFVDTPNSVAITSKDIWTEGVTIKIVNPDGSVSYEGTTSFRGRGNSTWNYPKKPYAIKLDKKASILGMPKHKRWVLLANWMDRTMMRNRVAFKLGECTQLEWTPRGEYVELVLNGKHLGNYLLCEQVKIDENRVNIAEIDAESEDITGGYLMELDTYFDEAFKFKSAIKNLPYMFKDPDEDISDAMFNYMQTYVNTMENELYNNFEAGVWKEYLDINSFVDYWYAVELTSNYEPAHPKSVYMYKDKGGKLCAGPMWDYDYYTFVPESAHAFTLKKYLYYPQLFNDSEFVSAVKDRWPAAKSNFEKVAEFIDSEAETIKQSDKMNSAMWPISQRVNGDEAMTFEDAVDRLKKSYRDKLEWLDSQINNM